MKDNTKKSIISVMIMTALLSGCSKNEEPLEDGYIKGYKNPKSKIETITSEEFAVFDVGDYKTVNFSSQDKSLNECKENNVAFGVIVTPSDFYESSMLKNVEYVKSLIDDNNGKMGMPVYLNIDPIMENKDLSNYQKENLINLFARKCEANGIYVGIYGTDTNLCNIKEYLDIEDLDSFLIMDSEIIKYTGVSNVTEDLKHKIVASEALMQTISDKEFNIEDKFHNDIYYVVKEGETIDDISLRTGYSVKDILRYNNIKEKDIKPGVAIYLPFLEKSYRMDGVITQTSEYNIKGADISYCQNYPRDWDKINANYDFLILRSGHGVEEDECLDKFYKECVEHDMPIGVYCFNEYTATNYNLADFKKNVKNEALSTLNIIKNKKISYPVYLDIEYIGSNEEKLPTAYVNAMLDIWYDTMTENGYKPGVYANWYTMKYLEAKTDYKLSEKFSVWLAGGDYYRAEEASSPKYTPEDLEFELGENVFNADIFQITNRCIGTGIGNGSGCVDYNVSRLDLQKTNDEIIIHEFKRSNKALKTVIVIAVPSAVVMSGFAYFAYKNISKRSRKRR